MAPFHSLNLSARVGDDPDAVAENRRRVGERHGFAPGDVVWMEQVHGREVAVVDATPAEPVPGVDALVTATAGVVLAVLVADCNPVLLRDDEAGVVAVAHAGRRGVQ